MKKVLLSLVVPAACSMLVRHEELLGILRNNALRLFPGVWATTTGAHELTGRIARLALSCCFGNGRVAGHDQLYGAVEKEEEGILRLSYCPVRAGCRYV
jgi:hypothetical protein